MPWKVQSFCPWAPHELTVVTHNVIPDVISNQRQARRNSKLNFSESLQGLQTRSMVAVLAGFLLLSIVQNLSKTVLLVDGLGKSFSLLSYWLRSYLIQPSRWLRGGGKESRYPSFSASA